LAVALLAVLSIHGEPTEAGNFKGKLSQYDFLSYEVDVERTDKRVVFTFDADLIVRVYDPMGDKLDFHQNMSSGITMVDFEPERKGKHTIILTSYFYPENIDGYCEFDVKEISTSFSTVISHDEALDYEIEVDDNRRPIVLHIDFEDTYDRVYPELFDPDGNKVNPKMDGSFTHSCYIFPARETGTYELAIIGSRIESADEVTFNASINYPVKGPGIAVKLLGMSPMTFIIVVTLLVVGIPTILILRKRMGAVARPEPRIDVSDFEQPARVLDSYEKTDYSYLSSKPATRIEARSRGPPPSPTEDIVLEIPVDEGLPTPSPPTGPPVSPSMAGSPPAPAIPSQQPSTPTPDGYTLPAPPVQPSTPKPQLETIGPSARPNPPPPDQAPSLVYPKCVNCGQTLLANHPSCPRCGAPR
jgi:hypothetical protein